MILSIGPLREHAQGKAARRSRQVAGSGGQDRQEELDEISAW